VSENQNKFTSNTAQMILQANLTIAGYTRRAYAQIWQIWGKQLWL